MSAPKLQAAQIEALADSLSASADELHERIMKAIHKNRPDSPPPHTEGDLEAGISHGAAQALFESEVALRQRANKLYLDAALLAGAGLEAQAQQLLDLVAQARHQVRRSNVLKDLIDLTADVLALGAALAAGKPEQLPATVDNIKTHLARFREDRIKPTTPNRPMPS